MQESITLVRKVQLRMEILGKQISVLQDRREVRSLREMCHPGLTVAKVSLLPVQQVLHFVGVHNTYIIVHASVSTFLLSLVQQDHW